MSQKKINRVQYKCDVEVPAHSIVSISNIEKFAQGRRIVYTVEQTTSASHSFAVTGNFDGSTGLINASEDMLVRYTGSLAAGDRCSPEVGAWTVKADKAGNYVVLGLVSKDSLDLAAIRLDPIKGGLRLIKAPSGGIPGRVGSLMGGAICDIVTFDSAGQLTVSSDQIKVYNWATSAVCANGDRYGMAGWVNSAWLIISEDCNDGGSTIDPGTGSGGGGKVESLFDFSVVGVAALGGGREVRYSGAGAGSGFE